MKIYAGWVVMINGVEYKVIGRMAIRKTTTIVLKDLRNDKKSSIERNAFIENYMKGSIKYIRSEAP